MHCTLRLGHLATRTKMPLVELIWALDRLKLFNQLNKEDRVDTYPLRGMLWFLTSGLLKEGGVYVDQWPNYRHVSCMHPCSLFSPTNQQDMVTVCTWDPSSFLSFINSVAQERNWHRRSGIVACYVEESIVDSMGKTLEDMVQSQCTLWKSPKPLRCFLSHKLENMGKYVERAEKLMAQLPEGLTLDRLKPSEAKLVSQQWAEPVPDKEDMFRWFISILPSPCIRDTQGRPVGWCTSYTFGVGAAGYVLPEYRGNRLAGLYTNILSTSLQRTCPTKQRFFTIAEGNTSSERSIEHDSIDVKRTDTMVRWLIYIPTPIHAKL